MDGKTHMQASETCQCQSLPIRHLIGPHRAQRRGAAPPSSGPGQLAQERRLEKKAPTVLGMANTAETPKTHERTGNGAGNVVPERTVPDT